MWMCATNTVIVMMDCVTRPDSVYRLMATWTFACFSVYNQLWMLMPSMCLSQATKLSIRPNLVLEAP
jgi:hypothetical protein